MPAPTTACRPDIEAKSASTYFSSSLPSAAAYPTPQQLHAVRDISAMSNKCATSLLFVVNISVVGGRGVSTAFLPHVSVSPLDPQPPGDAPTIPVTSAYALTIAIACLHDINATGASVYFLSSLASASAYTFTPAITCYP